MKMKSILKKLLIGVLCLCLLLVLMVGAAWVLRHRLLAAYLGISQPVYSRMVVEKDVMVPMRDGVRLATDIYRPDAPGTFPAVIVRLPYNKEPAREVKFGRFSFCPGILFTQRGLVLITQDVRGRYASEGDFYAFGNERQDSEDVVKWLKEQDWFNGDLGAMGPSYLGYTQWALAPNAGDTLKCMAPMVVSADLREMFYRGGAVSLMSGGGWAVDVGEREDGDIPDEFKTGMWHFPLHEVDDASGGDVDFYNDWVAHPMRDAYWYHLDIRREIPNITTPALLMGGWYDLAAGCLLEDYIALRNYAGNEAARNPRLIMGPWVHGDQRGDRDFGEEAGPMLLVPKMFNWNDYWLRGVGKLPEKPVSIFVMGINQWRDEDDWPLERAVYTPYYLHSGGGANTANGDGVLNETAGASAEPVDSFTYDPANPVPSVGGCFMGKGMGPMKQQEVESREDVLVYTSAPMPVPLEITGPVRCVLYAATSCEDTDFTVRLCDVSPDGTSINLVEGIVRGRFREAGSDTPLAPKEVYRYEIDLWATSNVFLKHHQIRVQVSSSNFPQFDRNTNLYGPFAQQAEYITAEQTIYHNEQYPSHIILPVIEE
jgi:uncharacterized protein